MSLRTKIEGLIKEAMKAKDANRLTALRSIKAMILLEETASGSSELSTDVETKLLVKAAKQRKESAEVFQKENRDDLYQKEIAELAVIEEFLPKALSEDELKARLTEIVARVGAKSPADLGKVMGVASKELAGIADGKAISTMVKSLLQG